MVAPAVSIRPFGTPGTAAHIFQGDADEIIPLAAVVQYARREAIPLTVIPGASHFFHGKLLELREAVRAVI
jgi:alpha/beta superfamily hydrolase